MKGLQDIHILSWRSWSEGAWLGHVAYEHLAASSSCPDGGHNVLLVSDSARRRVSSATKSGSESASHDIWS